MIQWKTYGPQKWELFTHQKRGHTAANLLCSALNVALLSRALQSEISMTLISLHCSLGELYHHPLVIYFGKEINIQVNSANLHDKTIILPFEWKKF